MAIAISVDKARMIGFEAGRTLVVLSLSDQDFVEVVGEDCDDGSLVLPLDLPGLFTKEP